MSNGSDGAGELRALFIPYGRVHVLLNRAQCTASLFASDVYPLRSQRPYLRELIDIGADRVLFFDLHRFFCDTFSLQTSIGAQLAVVTDTQVLEPDTRAWLSRAVCGRLQRLGVADDRLAFRIPSSTAMRTLQLHELAPHSRVLRPALASRGLLAVHPEAESMGFLIDIDRLIRSRLLFAGGEERS